ncbi:uncharacterized protein LOC129907882 [Episyrphus balteatus]|uniref:uncharacterized protein LOC129907882 n=1 Tax=Episyrphus balteatus TaxID=286459 RepID=UPI002486262E|nr:uncharacterized protein LOC129907882 [Episyrphus balteatus]
MALLEELIFASDQLVEFHADFKDKPSATFTVSLLEAFSAELSDLWSEFKLAYRQFMRTDDEELKRTSVNEVKAKYRSASNTYFICASSISDFLKSLQTSVSELPEKDSSLNFSKIESSGHNIKVPACDTQEFHGNYLQWPSFRDMFTAVYINHSKLSDVQKLFHLRAKTKDHAFDIVNKFKSSKDIKSLQSNINDAIIALKSYEINVDSWNAILIFLCASRLPDKTLNLFESSLVKPTEVPTWEQMNTFLSNRYRVLESVSEMKQITPKPNKTPSSKPISPKVKPIQNFHLKVTPSCQVCSEQHPLRLCPIFLKMSVDDRHKTVRKHKFCFNCLAITHNAQQCQSTSTCLRCKGRHHTLLHFERKLSTINNSIHQNTPLHSSQRFSPSSSQLDSSASSSPLVKLDHQHNIQSTSTSNHIVMFSKTFRQVLLATAIVKIHHFGNDFHLRALIDQGSEVSFITEHFQKLIGLPTQSTQARICGMGTTETASSSKLCTFTLFSNNVRDFKIQVEALVLKKLTSNLPAVSMNLTQTEIHFDFPLADPLFYQSSSIDMLIGADLYPHIILEGLKKNVLSTIIAQNTVFGWILLGPYETAPVVSTFSTFVTRKNDLLAKVDQKIERFWKLEELPHTPILTPSDQLCEDLYRDTTYRDPLTGRFVVRLPFKNPPQESFLGVSRFNAMQQYIRNEKSMLAKPALKGEYEKVLAEYISLNHMTPTSSYELFDQDNVQSFYLPHHAVLKPQSTTTKLRVVFNASSHSSNGHFLRGGPLLSPPEPCEAQKDISLIRRWNTLKAIHHQFSIRWKEEYLKELIKRYKWKYPQRDMEVGDLVVLRDEQLPPNEWRLGRVLEVHRGPDNRVRVVDVKTQKGVVRRSIVKLCILPSD